MTLATEKKRAAGCQRQSQINCLHIRNLEFVIRKNCKKLQRFELPHGLVLCPNGHSSRELGGAATLAPPKGHKSG